MCPLRLLLVVGALATDLLQRSSGCVRLPAVEELVEGVAMLDLWQVADDERSETDQEASEGEGNEPKAEGERPLGQPGS